MKTSYWKSWKWSFLVLAGVLCSLLWSVTVVNAAEEGTEDKPKVDLYVDVLSQYVFRGIAFSKDSAVIEPSMTVSYKGFSANIWGNLDTDEAEGFGDSGGGAGWNETDFSLCYTHEIIGGLGGTIGTVYYSIVGDDSVEVYGGLSYALPWFNVGFLAYREVGHFPGWWLQLDLTKNVPLPWYGMSVDLGASLGYQTLEDDDTLLNKRGKQGEYDAFTAGTFSVALNIPVGKYINISPRIGYSTPLSDEAGDRFQAVSWDGDDHHVYGGIRVAASF